MNSFKTILIAMAILCIILLIGANISRAAETVKTAEQINFETLAKDKTEYILVPDKPLEQQTLDGLAEKEFMRTTNSNTFCNLEETICKRKIFFNDVNQLVDNVWYSTKAEIATTTKDIIEPIARNDFLIKTANAQLATITPTEDNSITQAAATENRGSTIHMAIGHYSSSGDANRVLLRFNTGADPGDTVITEAELGLYNYTPGEDYFPVSIEVHELTQTAWVEAQATWNIYSTGNNWASAGGDYDTDWITTQANSADATYWKWYLIDQASGTPMTMDWSTEYNLLLKDITETGSARQTLFHSAEKGSNVPYVLLTYEDAATSTPETEATSTTCDMTAGTIDDDTISEYLLYFFYVILLFVILTMGYWIVDRFFHSLSGRKYD